MGVEIFGPDDLGAFLFLRMLLLGWPKVGKTARAVATSPQPAFVILCEDKSALRQARRMSSKWDATRVGSWDSMMAALTEARRRIKAGSCKTVVIDPLNKFVDVLLEQCFESTKTNAGNRDGRKAYPELARRLKHFLTQLFDLEAHIIAISHYQEMGGDEEDEDPDGKKKLTKVGKGIVPLMPGQARAIVAGEFHDVVWMETRNKEEGIEPDDDGITRIFVTGPEGAWGPGSRHARGTQIIPANIEGLIELFRADDKPVKKPSVKPTSTPATPIITSAADRFRKKNHAVATK